MCLLGFLRAVRGWCLKKGTTIGSRLLSESVGGRFRFGVGERGVLHVWGAVVSALVRFFPVVSWWFCVWLVCVLWLSCVFCVAAFGSDAVTFDFV